MATLKDVKALAKKLGARVEDDRVGRAHECRVEAPTGYIWKEGLHEFVAGSMYPEHPDYKDLLGRMEPGIELCPNPDCDWCNDNAAAEREEEEE